MRDFTQVSRSVTPRPTRSRVHGAYVVAASKPTAVAEPGAAYSSATHLLRNGRNTREIQLLLGHKHVTTTEIYPHIAAEEVRRVPSPLDLPPRSAQQREEDERPPQDRPARRWHPGRRKDRP